MRTRILTVLAAASVLCVAAASSWGAEGQQTLRAQPSGSRFTIELGKSGVFSVFGDDHRIGVTDYTCEVTLDEQDVTRSEVRLVIRTASLRVLDPQLAAEKRAEVQKKMESADVLDIARYPEITFASTKVEKARDNRFHVTGGLKIRDASHPVTFEVSLRREGNLQRVKGEAKVRQTSFGIEPVSAGGGTVKVKDEMKISFDLALVSADH